MNAALSGVPFNIPQLILWVCVLTGLIALWFSMQAFGSKRLVLRIAGVALICGGILTPWLQSGPKSPLPWEPYSDEAVKTAARPVMLYFYADWCAPCHQLDHFTFSDQRVQELSESFRLLKADLSDPRHSRSAALIERYQLSGIPVITFLKGGEELKKLRFFGFLSPEALLEKMQKVLSSEEA